MIKKNIICLVMNSVKLANMEEIIQLIIVLHVLLVLFLFLD